jgi:hypothetical protein
MLLSLMACQGVIGTSADDVDEEEAHRAREPRSARRLSAPQLRAALVGATGFDYLGTARVADPAAPQGSIIRDDAPLLDVYGASLGEPDYDYTVRPALEATVTFSKLAEDAIRSTCGQVADAEVIEGEHPTGRSHLLLAADVSDRLPADESAIRANVARLALRWWGQDLDADAAEVSALVELFRVGFEAAPLPEPTEDEVPPDADALRIASAWRTVCTGMLQDPQFLTY